MVLGVGVGYGKGGVDVRRALLRLMSLLSLCAYLLANTHASFALDYMIRSQPRSAHVPEMAPTDETTPTPRKCRHCNPVPEETSNDTTSQPSSCPTDRPCNDSSCPCCPNQHDPKDCPCPGGCALCSVAKAPCLTPWTPTLHQAVCIGQCCLVESLNYASPPQGGLIRPPRV